MLSRLRTLLVPFGIACLASTAISQHPGNGPAPTPGFSHAPQAKSANDKGWVIAGDIIVDKPRQAMPTRRGPHPESLGIAYSQNLWPKVNGVATVYYVIDPDSDPNATPKIDTAIQTFNADFPNLIQWVPWTSSVGPNYVDINLNANDTSGTCEAVEGYEAEPAQPVEGSTSCAVITILHEMGHVIGLWHEMTRSDRNSYVTINYNNVIKGDWPDNFSIETDNEQILALYDYASVMEYAPYDFSRNGNPVLESIPAGIPMGSVEGVPWPEASDYSAGDKETIQRLYGAPPTQVTVTSNPVGLQVVVDGQTVTTPQTYSWALNSTHTVNVPSNVQTLSGDIAYSTTAETFYYAYGRWNDNGSQSHTITVSPGNGYPGFPATSPEIATYTANFIQLVPYTSSVYPSGSGQVSISPQPQSYSGASGTFFVARQQATLTATPTSGWSLYEFNNGPYWLPGGLSANPKTFYVPDSGNPVNPTVYFTNTPVYALDVTPETPVLDIGAYADGGFWYTPKVFSSYYDSTWTPGSSHTLNIDSPQYPYSYDSRYAFSSWSDGGAQSHTIASLPASSTSYVATVTPQFAPATNLSYPPCGGTGSIMPASPTNDGFYPTGQQLSFSATPDTGWSFAGWSYDLTGSTNPASLTANDESLVFANFNTVSTPLAITGLSPSSAIAGGPSFTLTISGTGFTANSVVFINDTYTASTYVNSQTLQVTISSLQIASATGFQVYVENYPSGWTGCAVYAAQTFLVQTSQTATLTSPTPGTVLGSSATFTWTPGSGVSQYILYLGTASGSDNVYYSGVLTETSVAVSNLPENGVYLYATLYSRINGSWVPQYYTYTETGTAVAAVLTGPSPGSVLPNSSSVTFSWTAGSGPTGYLLYLGTNGEGTTNIYSSPVLSATSVTVSGIPLGGVTVFATLFSKINGVWKPSYYTYTEAGSPTLATMISPTQGATLTGSSATFSWNPGVGPDQYLLYVGTAYAQFNLYNSGILSQTSVTVNNLPTYGATIYVTLMSRINFVWKPVFYTYLESGTPILATMTSPTSGSTLGSSATFQWNPGGGPTAYLLYLGTTSGADNVFYYDTSSGTSVTVNNLPTNGVDLYATLYSQINGVWKPEYYTYVESGTPVLAAMTSPTQGSTLTSSTQTFTWSPGAGPTAYLLYLGTTAGADNLYYSGTTTATSATVSGLPTDGSTIYATLYSKINGSWQHPMTYTYTAEN